MTEEEKKAMYRLKLDINTPLACGDTTIVIIDDLETVLNLIQKQQAEIIETKEHNRQLSIELQKKDKIIDLMLDEMAFNHNINSIVDVLTIKKQLIIYKDYIKKLGLEEKFNSFYAEKIAKEEDE